MSIIESNLNLKNWEFFKFSFMKFNHLAKRSLELDDKYFFKLLSNLASLSFISSMVILIACTGYANEMCDTLNLGWHFYCDNKETQEVKEMTVEQAKAQLNEIQKKLEDLKIRAVMNPSSENIISYIKYQQEQLERASKFSEEWQKVVWQNPDIDYMVKTPLSSIGNDVREEMKYKNLERKLLQINHRYGIFFFYRSQCEYCIKFSSVLKVFTDIYHIEVAAISMDGGILPEWPGSQINVGQAQKFGMHDKPVPSVILFDSKTKQLIPVGFGLLTIAELEERIFLLTEDL